MKRPKQIQKAQIVRKSMQTNWLKFINDESIRLPIPFGPRFQVDVPEWTGQLHTEYSRSDGNESNTSRWLGTRIWPTREVSQETARGVVGKGRAEVCTCISPGSVECVKLHVANKRILLQFDLGSVFWRWKFDEMGEEVSNLWNLWEQKKFESLVKTNPVSTGKSFLKPAFKCLPSQCRETIVNYYFNVYLPRRMSTLTRSGCEIVDTDDEASEDAPCTKGSRKRCQADNHSLNTFKYMKTKTTLLSDRH